MKIDSKLNKAPKHQTDTAETFHAWQGVPTLLDYKTLVSHGLHISHVDSKA